MRVNSSRRNALVLSAFVTTLIGATSFLASLSTPVNAAQTVPYTINFQGRLTDNNGNILPDGSYNIKFRIMDAVTAGVNKWQADRVFGATDHRIAISNGLFNTQFGDTTQGDPALSPTLFSGTFPLYLEVELPTPATATCNTNACASFTEGAMTPRQALASAPYAFNSDTLDGLDSSAFGQLGTAQTWTNTNTFQPTANVSSVAIKQNSSGSFGQDIFSVQGSSSGNFIQITSTAANAGAVTVQSLGSNNLTLESGGALNIGPANATAINLGRTGLGVAIPATGVVAVSLTGVPATTTTSSLIQLTAAIAGGSANGTYVGANPSSFSGDFANFQVNGASRFSLNSLGDHVAGFTLLDGSTTTNGTSGLTPPLTSLTVTSSVNFDIGNYVQISDTNCGGAGVNPCYAKITAIAGNVLTISPGLTWTTGKNVKEYHVPELGGIDLTQTLGGRYGRGYFISGVATGNGTTYYNEGDITSSLASFDLLNTAVTTLNIGGAATTVKLGAASSTITLGGTSSTVNLGVGASGTVNIPGSLSVTGTISGGAPPTGTSGYFQRNVTTLSPATSGDAISTSGNILTTGTGTVTSAGAISAPTVTNTINGAIINSGALSGITTLNLSGAIAGATATNTINNLVINSGSLTNVGANITGAGAVTLASGAASALNLTGAAPSTWDIGANTLSLQTVGNGATTTGTGLFTTGGALTSTGALTVNNSALFKNAANSTSAFQIQNLASAALFKVDTTANNSNNLLTNPSIETAIAGNWQLKGSATVSQDPSQAYYGSNSLNIAATGIGGGAKQNVALSSNTVYSYALYARSPSGSISTFDIGRSEDGTNDIVCLTAQTILKNGWTRLSCSFTTGTTSGATYIYAKQTDATTRSVFIDAATLETDANTTTNYHEGQISLQASIASPLIVQNSVNSTTAFQVLTSKGSSVLRVDTTDSNIIAGSAGFEINQVGWSYSGTPGSIARDGTTAYAGNYSLKVVTTANANNGAKITFNAAVPSVTPLAISSTYTVSWYARLDVSSAAFTDITAAYARDGASEVNCTGIGTQTVVTGGWTRYSCQIVTDATTPAANAYIVIKQTGATAHTFYIDAMQVELGVSATGFGAGALAFSAPISSPVVFRSASDSTTAFQVQNAGGTVNLLTVDTLNQKVSIGGASPTITSAGALNLTGAAPSTWDIGANTLSVQTTGNGAITTGTGLLTQGGNVTFSGTTARIITGPTSGGLTINDTGGNLTLSTTTSGTLAVTSAGALNLSGAAASSFDIGNNLLSVQTTNNGAITTGNGAITTGTGLVTHGGNLTFSGTLARTITGPTTGGLTINDTGGNLTISTTTSGTLAVTSAGALNLTGATASTWDIGAGTLSVQTVGNGAITTGSGLVTHGGSLAVNGGSLTTTAATANLFNTGATTINFGAAATTLSVGAAAGTTTFAGIIADARAGAGTGDSTLRLTGAPIADATSSQIRLGAAIASGNAAASGGTYIGLNAPLSGAGSAADFLNFQNNGVSKLKLDSAGKATIQGTAGYNQASVCTTLANVTAIGGFLTAATCSVSDVRFKTNIQTVQSALEGVDKLRAVTYDFNDLYKSVTKDTVDHGIQYGLLAQEMEQVFPGLVKPVYGDYKTINYLGFTAVLARAIQELDGKVDRQLVQGSNASFGDVNVGGLATVKDLNVTGTATITTLHVTGTATFDGDIAVNGHFTTRGAKVQAVAGADAGDGSTVEVSGTDVSGTITIKTGIHSHKGSLAKVTFAKAFDVNPQVAITPVGSVASDLRYYYDSTTTDFSLGAGNDPTPGQTYTYSYLITQSSPTP